MAKHNAELERLTDQLASTEAELIRADARSRGVAGDCRIGEHGDGQMMKTWADLAKQEWRFAVDVDNAEATIVRPDPDNPRLRVGPIATVPLGMTGEDDEGEPCAFVDDNLDGLDLFAIAMLPEVARLIVWANEKLARPFNTDVATEHFLKELRRRVAWIKEGVDARVATISDGEHGFGRMSDQ